MVNQLKNITILLLSILIFSCSKKITNKSILDEKHNYDYIFGKVIESNMFIYENPNYFKENDIIRAYDFLNALLNCIQIPQKDSLIVKKLNKNDELIGACGLTYDWNGLNDRCNKQTLENWHKTFNDKSILSSEIKGFSFISLDTNNHNKLVSIFLNDSLIYESNLEFKEVINLCENKDTLYINSTKINSTTKPKQVVKLILPKPIYIEKYYDFINSYNLKYSLNIGTKEPFACKNIFQLDHFLFIYPRSLFNGVNFYKW